VPAAVPPVITETQVYTVRLVTSQCLCECGMAQYNRQNKRKVSQIQTYITCTCFNFIKTNYIIAQL